MKTLTSRARADRPLALAGAFALALAMVVPGTAGADEHDVPESRGIDRVCPPPDDAGPDEPADVDDTEGTAHEASIDCALDYGLVQGFGDGTYRPGNSVTRAQMATFVANWIETAMAEELPVPEEDQFPDIEDTHHADAINALADAGVIAGRSDGTYGPSEPISRGAMAVFVAGGADYADDGEVDGSLPPADDTVYFDDTAGTTFEAEIHAIAGVGIVQGFDDGTYRPRMAVTRGQLATFVMAGADYLDQQQRWEPTAAGPMTFEVALSAENELVVDEDTGEVTYDQGEPGATGTATLTVDAWAGTLDFELDYSEVTGPFDEAPGAHIHRGELDQNGGIVVGLATGAELEADADGMISGTLEEDTSEFRYAELIDDPEGFYVNVHSNDYPAGAIRGQLADPAGVVTYDLTMTGEAEVDDEGNPGQGEPDATATATLTIDDDQGTIEFAIDFSDVTGPFDEAPGVHVHAGAVDENGPIVVGLATGAELEAAADGMIEGTFTETGDFDLIELVDNPEGYYLNLHSNSYPGGAVRAQLG